MKDKDPYLLNYCPSWMKSSIRGLLSSAEVNGKKLEFNPDRWEKESIEKAKKAKNLLGAQELMEHTYSTTDAMGSWERGHQATCLLRYIMGPGKRKKYLKNFLVRYFRAVIEVAEEMVERREAERKKIAKRPAAQTEAEEERRYIESRKNSSKAAKNLIEQIHKKLNFRDSIWSKIESGYHRSNR